MGFFQELRRRRVFRVMLAYLVVGWAMIEVADTVFPYLRLPEWAVTLVIALVGLGLPVAAVLAWSFQITEQGVRRERQAENQGGGPAMPRRGPLILVVAAGLLVGAGALWLGRSPSEAAVDDGLVAVFPFRTSGAAPELAYLGEGLTDLLSVAFTGEVGPRALDSRVVLNALDGAGQPSVEEAHRAARRLGAGYVVMGEVVGPPSSVTVTASLSPSVTPHRADAVSVTGPVDRTPELVEELTSRLLATHSAVASYRIPALAGTPLPVIRSYLRGQEAYRKARYMEAEDHFRAAMEGDSTFALAALGFRNAAIWEHAYPPAAAEAVRLAWRHRDRLPPHDREFLNAVLGPSYPAPSTFAERMHAWEDMVERAPDRAEAWFSYGDYLFHAGSEFDACEDWRACAERSREPFERAHQLAPNWNTPLQHLFDIEWITSNRERALEIGAEFLAHGPDPLYEALIRSSMAVLKGDTAGVKQALESILDTPDGAPVLAMATSFTSLDPGVGSALAALDSAIAEAATDAERETLQWRRYKLGRNRGWASVAEDALDALEPTGVPVWWLHRQRVVDAIYWDGDRDRAADAAGELAALAPTTDETTRRQILCALGHWWLAREDPDELAPIVDRLDPGDEPPSYHRMRGEACFAVFDAALAVLNGEDAGPRLERADSILRQGPPIGVSERKRLNMALGGMFEAVGHRGRALRCARRHSGGTGGDAYASTYFRDTGRLAALLGQTERAADAYRRYLTLRAEPDPALIPERDRVRSALATLVREGS